ncbi:hypothetical protein QVN91_01680 [Bacteroides caecigallinarum]|nr:hypothetical protein [Bacteroides caecigallinarum]MDN0071351.1 hypothetical protein [Bacteroides caecigallinarum]
MLNRLKLVALFLIPIMTVKANDGLINGIKGNLNDCITVKKANEGWFMAPSVGTQIYVGDFDNNTNIGYRFSTAIEGQVGKWITPAIAVRLRGTAYRMTGVNPKGKRDAMNMINISADCMADVISFIKGVNEERSFTVLPFIGMGSNLNFDWKAACFSFTVGTQALFRVDKRINLFTELKWSFLGDKIDLYKGGIWCEGSAVLSAGFIYNF